ncbi:MAG: LarC family nickel insertion protein [Lachnospiraceae bacterium]|nr:LarC family nickel insertion protein [Lachnospiraceae bacterium]
MSSMYLDCEAGISGDMTVAALLDAGADKDKLIKALESIRVDGFSIRISRVKKAGLDCCDFDVVLDEDHENHDHDMDYLYGREAVGSSINKLAINGLSRDLGSDHDHGHHHRNLADITAIIDSADATKNARDLAKKIFHILAEAEAKAHSTTVDEVHFHEVGAIDSIADILAAAVCFDDLNVSEVIVPKLCDGQGTVRCQHGIIPVPVPAVVNISERYDLPLMVTDRKGEFVTPTGAAFVAAVMTGTKLPETVIPTKTGLGAGKRDYEHPGILKVVLYD